MSTNYSPKIFPIVSLMISATLWGIAWFPLRYLEANGVHGLWTSALIYSVPVLLASFLLVTRRKEIYSQPGWLIVIAVGNAWCNVAFILAILDGNIMRVLLLFYLSPLWATLLAWLILKEHMSRLAVFTLIIAMTGAAVMLWDPAIGHPWPSERADWLAISSGMAFALANVSVRRTQGISIPVKNLFSWIGVSLLAIVWIGISQEPVPAASQNVILWTLLLGPLMVFVMTFTVQYGVTKLPVYRSAVILLFELVAGAISSQLLTEEVMEIKEWIGGGFIILAAYLSARAYVHHPEEVKVNL
ncbi:MAG: DMT family transporter [Gammaproteobacteria bacterium]|jgi:drug/metabolite transporter (DMT)-like permease|nr:DMT family transporter [Gammaproteobacteria bacterium]